MSSASKPKKKRIGKRRREYHMLSAIHKPNSRKTVEHTRKKWLNSRSTPAGKQVAPDNPMGGAQGDNKISKSIAKWSKQQHRTRENCMGNVVVTKAGGGRIRLKPTANPAQKLKPANKHLKKKKQPGQISYKYHKQPTNTTQNRYTANVTSSIIIIASLKSIPNLIRPCHQIKQLWGNLSIN